MQIEQTNDIQIVRLNDDSMDRDIIESTFQTLVELLSEPNSGKLLLDFKDVGFIASPALGILISLHQHCEQHKYHLRFCNIKAAIYDVFSVTQVTRIFNIHDTEEDALSSF